MLEPETGGQGKARAYLAVGGASIARHQARLALALECQRIVCLSRGLGAELLEIQHEAERAGAHFNAISDPRQLSGIVSARDELVVFADGLLPSPGDALELLARQQCVLVQPGGGGAAGGFERIDFNHASAGALRIAGRLAEQLADLPPDYDAVSALTRIAIQSGVTQIPVPAVAREGGLWQVIADEAQAHAIERRWIALHLGDYGGPAPGMRLARALVRHFGPGIVHGRTGSGGVIVAAGLFLLLAVVAGLFAHPGTGLLMLGLGWTCRQAGAMLARVERASLPGQPNRFPREATFVWLVDLAIVFLVVRGVQVSGLSGGLAGALAEVFPPVMLIGLARILPDRGGPVWSSWLSDRLVLTLALGTAASLGYLIAGVHLAALALMGAALLAPRVTPRIT